MNDHRSGTAMPTPLDHEKQYAATFRKLYFHLYANSGVSRAERLGADLANVLLCKLASERNGEQLSLAQFLRGEGSANELLIPLLRAASPQLLEADERFALDDESLRYGLRELAPLTLHNAPAHALGEAFQALIGPRLRGDRGQFFTPRSLVRAMLAVAQPPPTAKVVDPACGTAGFLAETAALHAQSGPSEAGMGQLIAIEKDRDLARLAEALLEIVAPGRARVLNTNALDLAALRHLPASLSPFDADLVLTNPPFGTKIKISDAAILRQYALGHRWRSKAGGWQQEEQLREAQDPQLLFLELCIHLLRPGGKLGIVLPEGVFGNRSLGYVWDFVRAHGRITALIDCPRTTFQPGTDTKTNVLFFQKGAATPTNGPEQIWMAVALHCGHDRRGRNTIASGQPHPDDFQRIGPPDNQANTDETGTMWQRATISDPYYLVPRYYDKAPWRALHSTANRLDARLWTLGELAQRGAIHIRKGHEVGAEAYGSGDIPFIRTSDIANYEVAPDPTRAVNSEIYTRYAAQQQLVPGDILLVSDGRYRIGRTAMLHAHNYRCIVQSHIRIISVRSGAPFDAIELLYLLNLPMVQHQIRNLVFIQSTLGALGPRLAEICLPLPPPSAEWQQTIDEFRSLIEGRAALLTRLQTFEHPGYEL